jgi:hypothetical protein
VPAFPASPHQGLRNMAHSTLLTLVASKMGMPLASPMFGYSGAQALDPRSIGVVI